MNDDYDLRAAEYVIGLLTLWESRIVREQAANDPKMAASIESWERRLSPLADALPSLMPPLGVWRRLETTINFNRNAETVPQLVWWRWASAPAYRGALVGAICATFIWVSYIGYKSWKTPSETDVAAVISLDGKTADYKVEMTPDGYASVVAVDPNFPADATLQFWTLDGATPVSLGLLPPKGRFKLKRQLVPGAKLLISKEPKGGSPEAGPTGPIVYQGNLIKG